MFMPEGPASNILQPTVCPWSGFQYEVSRVMARLLCISSLEHVQLPIGWIECRWTSYSSSSSSQEFGCGRETLVEAFFLELIDLIQAVSFGAELSCLEAALASSALSFPSSLSTLVETQDQVSRAWGLLMSDANANYLVRTQCGPTMCSISTLCTTSPIWSLFSKLLQGITDLLLIYWHFFVIKFLKGPWNFKALKSKLMRHIFMWNPLRVAFCFIALETIVDSILVLLMMVSAFPPQLPRDLWIRVDRLSHHLKGYLTSSSQ